MKTKILTFALLFFLTTVLTAQSQVPSPRYGFSVCAIYDSIAGRNIYYIFGGAEIGGVKSIKAQPRADIYSFNGINFEKVDATMAPGSEQIPGMFGHNALVQNGKMYIFNGARSETTNASTYIFSYENSTFTQGSLPPYPEKMYVFNGTRSEANDATMIFVGGQKFDGTASNECWTYNVENEVWAQKAPIAYGGRWGGASALINDILYIFGGMSDNGPQQSLFAYNIINNNWNWLSPNGFAIPGIYGVISAQLGNNFYVSGGGMWSGKKNTMVDTEFSSSLYQFNVDTISGNVTISELSNNLPPSIFGAGWMEVENGDTIMYSIGGITNISTSGDTTLTNNFYRYNITDNIVQQYDTITQTWGAVQSSINETEFKPSQELSIFPNPVSTQINFALQTNERIKIIKIFNQNGQLIQQISNPKLNEIDFTDKTTGLYFIRIDTEKNYYLGKVIKQ